MRIEYYNFWNGFYAAANQQNQENTLQQFFTRLFSCVEHTSLVEIHSVFQARLKSPQRREGCLVVHFSGEPFQDDDASRYDLSLVMKPDNVAERVVWFPLFSVGSYEKNYWPLYWTPRPFVPKSRFCAFVVSNPRARIRNRFFEKLCAYKRVDSCGSAMNNCGFVAPHEGYLDWLKQFKFMICFENTSSSHYITEKLHNAWLGGTIPIYWGCPNAKHWLNDKAFLYLDEAATDAQMDAVIQKIIELDQDDAKYMEMYNQLLTKHEEIPVEMRIETMQQKITESLRST